MPHLEKVQVRGRRQLQHVLMVLAARGARSQSDTMERDVVQTAVSLAVLASHGFSPCCCEQKQHSGTRTRRSMSWLEKTPPKKIIVNHHERRVKRPEGLSGRSPRRLCPRSRWSPPLPSVAIPAVSGSSCSLIRRLQPSCLREDQAHGETPLRVWDLSQPQQHQGARDPELQHRTPD